MKRGFSTLGPSTDEERKRPKKNKTKPKAKTAQRKSDVQLNDSFITIDGETDAHFSKLSSNYRVMFENLQKHVEAMAEEMKVQKKQIKDVTAQLASVMATLQGGSTDDLVAAAVNSFAAAVKKPVAAIVSDRSVQETVVAAVYVDNQRRQKRSTDFIVSGLPTTDDQSDTQAVTDLCHRELGETPDIVHTKRLGKPTIGRAQPLLVVLKTAAQAVSIVSAAKQLRKSKDQFTSTNVFIGANLTKAEARAAYELRCQRRQAEDRKKKDQNLTQNTDKQAVTQSLSSQQNKQQQQQSTAAKPPATESNGQQAQRPQQPRFQQSQSQSQQQSQQLQPHSFTVSAEIHRPQPQENLQQQQPCWHPYRNPPSSAVSSLSSFSHSPQLWQRSQLPPGPYQQDIVSRPTIPQMTMSTGDLCHQSLYQQDSMQRTASVQVASADAVPPVRYQQPLNPSVADFVAVPAYNTLQFQSSQAFGQTTVDPGSFSNGVH